MTDTFLTLKISTEGYFMDRGSKFHAYAIPVLSEQDAAIALQGIKKEHPKARHYCTAIRLFPDASLERSSDDGEPSGSAGKPILGQLIKNGLTNVLVIVVRYFGGTKLGVPGLIEAYKTSTANALAAGEIISKKVYAPVRIYLSYEQWPSFVNLFRQQEIPIFKEEYDPVPALTIGLSKSNNQNELLQLLQQYSQLDFDNVEAYENQLHIRIEKLNYDEIV